MVVLMTRTMMMMMMMMKTTTTTTTTRVTKTITSIIFIAQISTTNKSCWETTKCTYFTIITIDNNKIKHKVSNRTQKKRKETKSLKFNIT